MSGFGPRTYLVGQILPLLLKDIRQFENSPTAAEQLDEAIRLAMYIADLTIGRMGFPYDGQPPVPGERS